MWRAQVRRASPGRRGAVAQAFSCLAVAAASSGSLLLVDADARAAAVPPSCPRAVGDFTLFQNDVRTHGPGDPWDGISCTYRSVDFSATSGTAVRFTVSWQVVESQVLAVVGAAPCSGKPATVRESGSLSVASADRRVGSYASAAKVVPGGGAPTTVPDDFAPVLTDLVTAAGPLALPCSGSARPSSPVAQAPNPGSSKPAAPSGSSGLTFDYTILIAAGLIMMLLTGGISSLPVILRHLRTRTAPAIDRIANDALVSASGGRPDPLLPGQARPAGAAGTAGPVCGPGAPSDFVPITGPSTAPVGSRVHPGSPPTPAGPAQPSTVIAAQVDDLENTFATTVNQRLAEGYWVRNPSLMAKAWNTFTHPWWGSHSGQCGEFADNGVRWMGDYVHDRFGPGAVVDTVYLARRSVFVPNPDVLDEIDAALPMNHAATRVILPDGRRYVLDFWEAMGRSQGTPPKLVPEDLWASRWAGQIPEAQISRTADELSLREQILTVGQERAFAVFRQAAARAGQSAQAETLIRSWSLNPW